MSDRWPVLRWVEGEAVPDLRDVPEEDWVAAITPLSAFARHEALARLQPAVTLEAYGRLIAALPPVASVRRPARQAANEGASLPEDARAAPDWRRARQVSMRLSREQHIDLVAAARAVGTTPGKLARLLVVSGARRVLREHS